MVFLCGCIGENNSKILTSYNKAGARNIAEDFIKKTDSYGFTGRSASCDESRQLSCDGCWQFKCTFRESEETMFGGKIHDVDISIVNNTITHTMLDGNITLI